MCVCGFFTAFEHELWGKNAIENYDFSLKLLSSFYKNCLFISLFQFYLVFPPCFMLQFHRFWVSRILELFYLSFYHPSGSLKWYSRPSLVLWVCFIITSFCPEFTLISLVFLFCCTWILFIVVASILLSLYSISSGEKKKMMGYFVPVQSARFCISQQSLLKIVTSFLSLISQVLSPFWGA